MLSKIFIFIVNIIICLSINIYKVQSQNENTNYDSMNLTDFEFLETTNDSRLSIKIDPNESLRNKRALGIFLQGLVQALGYNTTPIQIASLPNPNTNGMPTGPVSIDTRSVPTTAPAPPGRMPSTTMSPAQRETLRFTGVVNFGNNSDIVGHLGQYERLFHRSTTSPPPSSTKRLPSSTTAPVSKPAPLLEPYFVPIPIPLAENLRYPRPIISIVTTSNPVANSGISGIGIDERKVPKQIIPSNTGAEDDKRIVNTNPHVSCSFDEKVKGHNGEEKDNYEEGEREEVSGEYDDHKATPNDEGSEEEHSYEDKREEEQHPLREEEKEAGDGGVGGEELDDEEEKEKGSAEEYKEGPLYTYETDNLQYNKNLKEIQNYQLKLPIEIKPFQGQLMNSYGQSLEHGGKIDESVADYFARFKNPQSGIFDPLSTLALEGRRRKLVSDEISDSLEQIRGFVPQFRYEEYELANDRIDRAGVNTQILQKEGEVERKSPEVDRGRKTNRNQNNRLPTNIRNHDRHEKSLISEGQSTNKRVRNKTIEPIELVNYQPYYRPQYYFSPDYSSEVYNFKNASVDENPNLRKRNNQNIPLLEEVGNHERYKLLNQEESTSDEIHNKTFDPIELVNYQPYYNKPQDYFSSDYSYEEYNLKNDPVENQNFSKGSEEEIDANEEVNYHRKNEKKPVQRNEGKTQILQENLENNDNKSYRSNESSEKIEHQNVKILEKPPIIPQPFDFVSYQPYYKPVQYYYTPESLERTAQSITSYFNEVNARKSQDKVQHVGHEQDHSSETRRPELSSSEKIQNRSIKQSPEVKKSAEKISEVINRHPQKLQTSTQKPNRSNRPKPRQANRNINNSHQYTGNNRHDRKIEQPMMKEHRNSTKTHKIQPRSD